MNPAKKRKSPVEGKTMLNLLAERAEKRLKLKKKRYQKWLAKESKKIRTTAGVI